VTNTHVLPPAAQPSHPAEHAQQPLRPVQQAQPAQRAQPALRGTNRTRDGAARPLSGTARRLRLAYRVLAWLFALGVVAQVFLAGWAIFVDGTQWSLHTTFVGVLELLGVLLLALAFAGRLAPRRRWLTGGAVFLVYLQYVTANVPGAPAALHPVNALLIFWLAVFLARAPLELPPAPSREPSLAPSLAPSPRSSGAPAAHGAATGAGG
jgi:hypothetical protein